MSKKQSLRKEIAKYNSRIAELQKQLKQQELQDKIKLADEVIAMYKSNKLDIVHLKISIAKLLNEDDSLVDSNPIDESSVQANASLKTNLEENQ